MSTPQEQIAAQMKALGVSAPEGWAALDPTSAQNAAKMQALERYQRAKVIADGISPAALAVLVELTTEAQTFNVPELGLVNAIGFGIWREGQNALVRWIRTQKEIAAAGPGGDIPAQRPKRGK